MEEDQEAEPESEGEKRRELPERGSSQPPENPQDQVSSGSDGSLLPVPVRPPEDDKRQVMVPSNSEMELTLSQADDGDSLANLAKAAAALLEVAKRQNLMKQQLFEIAEWHLRVKRKLGAMLMQTVSWGGDRSRCHDDILLPGGLPKNLNGSAAKRCRRLAEIEESVFQQYLDPTFRTIDRAARHP